ncbi:MAG: NifU N-terminal domain-containing protein [Candidatus Paceibacteria bacterium]
MLYQLEYCPNPDCLTVHVNKKLICEGIESFKNADWDVEKQSTFVRDIFNNVDGITEISVSCYEIFLIKGTIFEWKDMIDKIIFNLQMTLAPQEEMKEKAAPVKYYIDEKGYRRDTPQSTDEGLHSFKSLEEKEEL